MQGRHLHLRRVQICDAVFDPVDAGPLRIARCIEPFALLVGQLAYGGRAGPELAYRFEWFGNAA
jgi:predicted dinucleotide-binding enzyme